MGWSVLMMFAVIRHAFILKANIVHFWFMSHFFSFHNQSESKILKFADKLMSSMQTTCDKVFWYSTLFYLATASSPQQPPITKQMEECAFSLLACVNGALKMLQIAPTTDKNTSVSQIKGGDVKQISVSSASLYSISSVWFYLFKKKTCWG